MGCDRTARGGTTNELSVATMMADVMARVAIARQTRAAAGGPNEPCDPATFEALYVIKMDINLDDEIDDQRRIDGEHWCLQNARHRWSRRTDKRRGVVRFRFEHLHDATMFRLSN